MHGGFIQHCLASNVFFREQLIELHDGPVALHVTRDTRGELRALGPSHDGAAVVCKRLANLNYEPPSESEEDEDDDEGADAGEGEYGAAAAGGEEEGAEDGSGGMSDDGSAHAEPDDIVEEPVLSAGQRRRRRLAARKAAERQKLEEAAEAARHPDPSYAATNHCLRSLLREQPGQYVLAVQDPALRAQLRRLPGVPIVFADKGTGLLMFEDPSGTSEAWAVRVEQQKQLASEAEQRRFGGQLVDVLEKAAAEGNLKKRKRKGVNPLSAKKKAKKPRPDERTPAPTDDVDVAGEEGGAAEVVVTERRLRQRARQRRRVRQRVRHHRQPPPEPPEPQSAEEGEEEQATESESGSESESESGSGSGSESESEEMAGKDDDQEEEVEEEREEEAEYPDEAQCHCGLPASTLAHGAHKRHVERGATAKYPNRGRLFYCCGKHEQDADRCSYFAWAEPPPPIGEGKKQKQRGTLAEKLLAKGAEASVAKVAEPAAPAEPATGRAALRNLRKLSAQIELLKQKAEGGIEALSEAQRTKLARREEVQRRLEEAEATLVKQAFAAPQLVIAPAPAPDADVAQRESGKTEAAAAASTEAATESSGEAEAPSSAAPIPVASAQPASGQGDPLSDWYAAVGDWIRSKPPGGTGMGQLGSAVPPPPGAPKLKRLVLRAKHLRIAPSGQVELAQ